MAKPRTADRQQLLSSEEASAEYTLSIQHGYYYLPEGCQKYRAEYRARISHAVNIRWGSSTDEIDTVNLADERGFEPEVNEMVDASMTSWWTRIATNMP